MNKTPDWYTHRNKLICEEYVKADRTTESLATRYGVTPRQLQRILKTAGCIRTISESNKLMSKFKNYEGHKNPNKVIRKSIPKALRYRIISENPFCKTCGATAQMCPLQVDHIDGNPRNNGLSNLQVLCMDCNYGKK